MTEPADQPAKRARSLTGFYVVLGIAAALAGLGFWLYTPMRVSYHLHSLRKLRTAGADAMGRHFAPEHLLEADGHFQELFRLGAVREGMSYDRVIGVIGEPDKVLRHRDDGARAYEWGTAADDGCNEGYVLIFGPDDRAEFVPHRLRPGEQPSSNASGHGPDWLVRYPVNADDRRVWTEGETR